MKPEALPLPDPQVERVFALVRALGYEPGEPVTIHRPTGAGARTLYRGQLQAVVVGHRESPCDNRLCADGYGVGREGAMASLVSELERRVREEMGLSRSRAERLRVEADALDTKALRLAQVLRGAS